MEREISQRAPDRAGVLRAAEKIAQILPPTPLLPVTIGDATIYAKAECLQPVGAFKIRGAWHRLSDLNAQERQCGVVAVSSGNHAQGVAWAAKVLGIEATIVMPEDAPPLKLERTRGHGATVITYNRMRENREEIAKAIAEEKGAAYVHAFANAWVIEGQGTAGIEITDQLAAMGKPPPTRIIACCGGGGLSAGLALACPDAEIVPVEPKGWDDVCRSIETGAIQSIADNPPATACDALQTFATSPINFAVLKDRCTYGVRVSEAEIREAQRFAFSHLRLVVEPGGAVALAAALSGKVSLDGSTALIISGGNVDPDQFRKTVLAG